MGLEVYKGEKNPLENISFILAVAAGKGGVGKSTVSASVAYALQERGLKVGLLDADIYGPSLAQMLGEDTPPQEDENGLVIPAKSGELSFISTAHFRKEGEAALVRAPIANGIIEQFLHAVNWGPLDVLVIDFPPGTGDIQLTLAQKGMLSAALLVTTPQEVALLDVRKAAQVFLNLHVPILGVVENMSYFRHAPTGEKFYPFGLGGGEKLAGELNAPLLAEIPLEPLISDAGDEGRSIFDGEASQIGALFTGLAHKVWEALLSLPRPQFSARIEEGKTLSLQLGDRKGKIALSTLQKHCPCARCEKAKNAHDDAIGLEVAKVGRYALRVSFSKGCSQGIYPFELLQELL